MFKRFIFILILLTIAFFVYRKINPEGAQTLINKVNHILGRDEVVPLTGDALTGDILIWDALTWELLTGDLLSGELLTEPTTTTLTPCAVEWEFANEALWGPANCCEWLQGFFTGQGIWTTVDPGSLCYDPAKWVPRCTTIDGAEWRYSSWTLLVLDDCDTTPITDPVVAPTVETPTSTTTTITKPKTSKDVTDTQNLINSLFK